MRRLSVVLALLLTLLSAPVQAQDCDPRVAEAILYIDAARDSHQVFIEWMTQNPGSVPPELPAWVGDIVHHQMWVERYTIVLDVLGSICMTQPVAPPEPAGPALGSGLEGTPAPTPGLPDTSMSR